jgi:acyl carrier protein
MTAQADLEEALRDMVARRLHVLPLDVPLEADIVADLGLESLEIVTFLLDVEQRYPPVAFEALQASEVRSLRDLAAYIVRLRGE